MGVALYRKYRSKSLEEIVGQEHITKTLHNTLQNGSVSHAYLFTGPRGTGKTSIARILAHQINDLEYTDDTEHLDIIEIDAASNRRIDEIRELRERVHTAPTSAKYKVYIIDEVHMLTKEAFNALLKTLEEPPEHVIFILATTEFHKLPETIISRTQRFAFKPVSAEQVAAHLRYIADTENIKISDDALHLIAEHGGGSFRDSISLLDQMRGHKADVSLELVQAAVGIAPQNAISTIIAAIANNNPKNITDTITDLRMRGFQSGSIAKQLAVSLRGQLTQGTYTLPPMVIIDLLKNLLEVSAARDQDTALDIILLQPVLLNIETPNARTKPVVIHEAKLAVKDTHAPVTVSGNEPQPEPKAPAVSSPADSPLPAANATRNESTSAPQKDTATIIEGDLWASTLALIKSKHAALYSTARLATPHIDNDLVTLYFAHSFHQKRADEPKNKKILADCLSEASGKPVTVVCTVNAQKATTAAPDKKAAELTTNSLTTISNIFGGGELLES